MHIAPTYWPAVRYGGPIVSVHALCRALAKRGHKVDVFTTNVDGVTDSDVPIGLPVDVDGVQVSYFPSKILRRLYWSPQMGRMLTKSIAAYDIAHLNSVFLWPTWAAARTARSAGVPYLISPRGMLVPELIRRKSRWAKSAWIGLIEKSNLMNAAAIQVTSNVEAMDLNGFGWRLPPIVTIKLGVDDPPVRVDAPISQDVSAAIADGVTVLAFGRINWKKGLDRLVACLPWVPKARLVIAGDDDEGYAAVLKRDAKKINVGDRVVILARHVDGADKELLFAAARIFAMPSLSESFGLVAAEAMRRAVPVLTVAEAGAAEIVSASGGGLIVAGEPRAMAKGIETLMSNLNAARAMGNAGQAYVMAHQSWDSVAEKMETLYSDIVSPQRVNSLTALT